MPSADGQETPTAARPGCPRSRTACSPRRAISGLPAGITRAHHRQQRHRPRAGTVFEGIKQRRAAAPPSSLALESLDLSIPLSRDLFRFTSILEGSIEEALAKLQCYQMELSTDDEEDEEDDADDPDEAASDTGSCIHVEGSDDSPHLPSVRRCSNPSTNKKDTETLQAFLNDVYELLSSIRRDINEQLPAMPQIPAMSSIKPSTFDKRAVLESLSANYEKAQEVLLHLSLYSPLSISLPELPASLAASISSAARGALAAASNTAQSSYPFPSMGSAPDSTSMPHLLPPDGAISAPTSSLSESFQLPRPPVSAIRAFLQSESAKLSTKLPKLKRPSLNDWPSAMGSSHAVQTISNVYNEATHFVNDETEKIKEYIHDEKEKIKDYIHDETEKLRNALIYGKSRLLEFHELPTDWKNNKYILSGYRFIPADRPGELILSAFKWHNETVNIYTHFIPAAYIIYYIFQVFPHTPLGDPTLNTFYDRSANLAFLIASLVCLLLSSSWHLASGCGTYSVFHSCATLDYLGISALISTSIISLTHAAFRCDPAMDLAYNLTTGIFGVLGLYLPWKPWFNDRAHKNVRITFFVLLSCVGAAPIAHMSWAYGGRATWQFYSPVLYSLLAYKVGLLFYATDFPEAIRPGGIFDTIAHSHQFWHCAIVVAIALHWQALKGMNEAGLQGYSCTGRDPYEVQYFMKWLHRRDEL